MRPITNTHVVLALDRSFDALERAQVELALAAAMTSASSALGNDALLLSRNLELEAAAVHEAIRRGY